MRASFHFLATLDREPAHHLMPLIHEDATKVPAIPGQPERGRRR